MKFLGLTTSVKYLGVQMVACRDMPSEVKKQIFSSYTFHHEEEKKHWVGLFEIFEAAYSTTRKTVPNPMLHDVKGYQHCAELRVKREPWGRCRLSVLGKDAS